MAYEGNQVLLDFFVLGCAFQSFLDVSVLTFLGSFLDRLPKEVYLAQMTMSEIERPTRMINDRGLDMGF